MVGSPPQTKFVDVAGVVAGNGTAFQWLEKEWS